MWGFGQSRHQQHQLVKFSFWQQRERLVSSSALPGNSMRTGNRCGLAPGNDDLAKGQRVLAPAVVGDQYGEREYRTAEQQQEEHRREERHSLLDVCVLLARTSLSRGFWTIALSLPWPCMVGTGPLVTRAGLLHGRRFCTAFELATAMHSVQWRSHSQSAHSLAVKTRREVSANKAGLEDLTSELCDDRLADAP